MASTTQTPHNTSSDRRRAPILNPGHGDAFTDHMVTLAWSPDDHWHQPQLRPLQDLSLHPGTLGLHYGQVIYEGMKAHRQPDGSIAIFRPWDNARRFQRSARRLAMPVLPEHSFVDALDRLVAADEACLSDDPTHSIYLRPLMIGTDTSLMLRPSREYLFMVMAFVAGGFFGDDTPTISVWIHREHARAFPGGTGDVKVAPNYAPTFQAQRQAEEAGCQQVVWLDAIEGRWLEEMSGMNLFLVRCQGSNAEVITPSLTGTLLPGVTRDSVLTLAARLGYTPREERIPIDRLRAWCEQGQISEMFACGTAAVITPVGHIRDGSDTWTVGDGTPGQTTMALRHLLIDLHHGHAADPDGWMHPVTTPSASEPATPPAPHPSHS